MKKLLLVALILGLILARKVTARELPRLSASPKPLTDAPGIPSRSVFAAWHVEAGTFDVLEMSSDMETWIDVAGPYAVRDLGSTLNYWVRVPAGYAKAFFRVRRVWGNPWVN